MGKTSSTSKPGHIKPARAKATKTITKKVRFAEPPVFSTTDATLTELMVKFGDARAAKAKAAKANTSKALPKAILTTIPMDILNDVLATDADPIIKEEVADPIIKEEVAVNHNGTEPSASTKEVEKTPTRPRPSSPTPPPTPPPKPSSSTHTHATPPPSPLHRPPTQYILRPPQYHFRTTGHPALHSHHHLPYTLNDQFYNYLNPNAPLTKTLQERGLRTGEGRIEITRFHKDLADEHSEYLVEGRFVPSGATLHNKKPETGLLRPQWLTAGVEDCGKCGASYGHANNLKGARKYMGYHQGTLTRRSRSKKAPNKVLPSTNSNCRAVACFIYATD